MNACEHFVDELVKLVPGPGLKRRLRAAAILIATVKSNLDYGVRSRELDVTGFREKLVQYGQLGQAIRHMRTHAALMLLGPVGWLPGWGLHMIDWLQSRRGRAESLTEMEDNKAGKQLGKLMVRGFRGQLSQGQLKVEMLRLIGE